MTSKNDRVKTPKKVVDSKKVAVPVVAVDGKAGSNQASSDTKINKHQGKSGSKKK